MNVPEPTSPIRRGSSDRAPRWRIAISLATSIALHALLLILFLRPAPPVASPGRFDVVTVHLRDSRAVSPPSTPERRMARVPGQRVDVRRNLAAKPAPLGREPILSAGSRPSTASDKAVPGTPARTAEKVAVTLARAPDAPRQKASPVDLQGNHARDSSALYMRELAERLSRVKHYPRLAVALREEGTVLLSFQVDRDGRLLGWNIASSSGHDDLDSEVGRMVAAAAPFPPFPPSWSQSEKAFRVPIGFYLR